MAAVAPATFAASSGCPADAISQSEGFAAGPGGGGVASALRAEKGGGGGGGLGGAALCARTAVWPNGTKAGEGTGPTAGTAAGAAGTVNAFRQVGQLICVPV